MNARARSRRRGEDAQALVETAIVLPLLILISLGLAGIWVVTMVASDVQTATTVATASAFAVPAGSPDIMASVQQSFSETLGEDAAASAKIECPRMANGVNDYLYTGQVQASGQVFCRGSRVVSFAHSPIGLVWRWNVTVSQEQALGVPQYRQCAPEIPTC